MQSNFDFSFNLMAIGSVILSWCVIGFLAFRIYKKQEVKPKIWKVLVCILAGIFSFSINIPFSEQVLKISILPLGVWILYWILKSKEGRWEKYRAFAWLGFFANYLFLATYLLSIPLQHAVYPESQLSTFIGNTEKARVLNTHPSALNYSLNKKSLLDQIPTMKQNSIQGMQWYDEEEIRGEGSIKRNERFPYQLIGTSSKWGSGIKTNIYMEADGKGLLISTPRKQLYFRSEESLLKGVK